MRVQLEMVELRLVSHLVKIPRLLQSLMSTGIPDNDDYPLDVAGEEEVTTQDKEDVEDDEEDEEDEEEEEEEDEEEDEELDAMIKVGNVQAGNVA